MTCKNIDELDVSANVFSNYSANCGHYEITLFTSGDMVN